MSNPTSSPTMAFDSDQASDAHLDPTPDFLSIERRRFASDRHGLRQLGRVLDLITTRSLVKFTEMITGDPLLRQILIADTYQDSYVGRMERAAQAALAHAETRSHEHEALFAAALVAHLPERIRSYGLASGTQEVPGWLRRCDYFMNSALTRLHSSDAAQSVIVFGALGVTLPKNVNDLHSSRLERIVRQAWMQADAEGADPADRSRPADPSDSSDPSNPRYSTL